MNDQVESLFDSRAVFISNQIDSTHVFEEVSQALVNLDFVKPDFINNLLEREANFPTGIDMSVVAKDLPNIAIPHTEPEFVKVRKVIPIKLSQPVTFHNMIDPDSELSVRFLFMILNNEPAGQANVLSEIMDFLTTTPFDELIKFFDFEDSKQIYDFLETFFMRSKKE